MAKALDISEERICVNVVNVGGEFGGKGDAIDLPIAYFLAQKSSQPVKIVMNYAEELSAGNPAHPTIITIRSGVNRDGRIVGRSLGRSIPVALTAGLKPTHRWLPGTTSAFPTGWKTPISNFCRSTPILCRADIIVAQARWRWHLP